MAVNDGLEEANFEPHKTKSKTIQSELEHSEGDFCSTPAYVTMWIPWMSNARVKNLINFTSYHGF